MLFIIFNYQTKFLMNPKPTSAPLQFIQMKENSLEYRSYCKDGSALGEISISRVFFLMLTLQSTRSRSLKHLLDRVVFLAKASD